MQETFNQKLKQKNRLEEMCPRKKVYENSARLTMKHRRPRVWEKTDRCHFTLPNVSVKYVQNLPAYLKTANDCIIQRQINILPYLLLLEIAVFLRSSMLRSSFKWSHSHTDSHTNTHPLLLLTPQSRALAACPSTEPHCAVCCSCSSWECAPERHPGTDLSTGQTHK